MTGMGESSRSGPEVGERNKMLMVFELLKKLFETNSLGAEKLSREALKVILIVNCIENAWKL